MVTTSKQWASSSRVVSPSSFPRYFSLSCSPSISLPLLDQWPAGGRIHKGTWSWLGDQGWAIEGACLVGSNVWQERIFFMGGGMGQRGRQAGSETGLISGKLFFLIIFRSRHAHPSLLFSFSINRDLRYRRLSTQPPETWIFVSANLSCSGESPLDRGDNYQASLYSMCPCKDLESRKCTAPCATIYVCLLAEYIIIYVLNLVTPFWYFGTVTMMAWEPVVSNIIIRPRAWLQCMYVLLYSVWSQTLNNHHTTVH